MGIKKFRPITPSQRFRTVPTFEEITSTVPEKSLLVAIKKSGGRNNKGRVTARHRGGGHKRYYRIIDFKRDKHNIPARVASIEYDPNRSAYIALLHYVDGDKRYILAPEGLRVDESIMSGDGAEIKTGNSLPLRNMPLGTTVHNVEVLPGKGGLIARAAGTSVQLVAKEGDHAHLKMPSGEVRLVKSDCHGTIGVVSNAEHKNISWGKAGAARWRGWRPRVRGVAMNPVDHPMGGGEGKTSGGRHPCSPWGQKSKGLKTRSKRKSTKNIVESRSKNKKKN